MRSYLELVKDVLTNGTQKNDRTGTGTLSVFGRQLRMDLGAGFPLLTTKRVFWHGVLTELLWFIRGGRDVDYLHEHGVSIWDEWADPHTGDLGPVYGKQWRAWSDAHLNESIDQLQKVIDGLRKDPDSRRHIVSAWNVAELQYMALEPCHTLFQFYSRPTTTGRYLDCRVDQRSADIALGVPFNVASYAALTHMVATLTGHRLGELIFHFGDVHAYLNHVEGLELQLTRTPDKLPWLRLNTDGKESIDDFTHRDFTIVGYNPKPFIRFDVSK